MIASYSFWHCLNICYSLSKVISTSKLLMTLETYFFSSIPSNAEISKWSRDPCLYTYWKMHIMIWARAVVAIFSGLIFTRKSPYILRLALVSDWLLHLVCSSLRAIVTGISHFVMNRLTTVTSWILSSFKSDSRISSKCIWDWSLVTSSSNSCLLNILIVESKLGLGLPLINFFVSVNGEPRTRYIQAVIPN